MSLLSENRYKPGDRHLSDRKQWPHVHGTPVFARFSDTQSFIFVWPEKDALKRFQWHGTWFDQVPRESEIIAPPYVNDALDGMPGGMLSVNIDPTGPGRGVVFASMVYCGKDGASSTPCDQRHSRGILRAYDPLTMREIWCNVSEAGCKTGEEDYVFSRFVPPTIAAGRVFVATASGKVLVYGRARVG